MGIVDEGEGQHIPTKEEQEAQINKQRSELEEQQELHRKMRKGQTAEYQRKPFETTAERSQREEQREGQQQEDQQQQESQR